MRPSSREIDLKFGPECTSVNAKIILRQGAMVNQPNYLPVNYLYSSAIPEGGQNNPIMPNNHPSLRITAATVTAAATATVTVSATAAVLLKASAQISRHDPFLLVLAPRRKRLPPQTVALNQIGHPCCAELHVKDIDFASGHDK
jgi:hypothetical protein